MSMVAGAISIAMLGAPNIDPVQQECMAKNIYFESRGEVIQGQIAVAHVTVNRVKHENWPDTICEVVYQDKQFSWTHQIEDQTPKDERLWEQALIIARDVMIGNTDDPSKGAVFYHANWVNPSWSKEKSLKVSKIIGAHIFYTWDGKW